MSGADGDDVKLHMLAEDQQDGKFIIKKESHTLNMLVFFHSFCKVWKLFCFDVCRPPS